MGSGGLINDQNNVHPRGSQNARGTGGFGTLSPQNYQRDRGSTSNNAQPGYHNFHPKQESTSVSGTNNTGHSIVHGSNHFHQLNNLRGNDREDRLSRNCLLYTSPSPRDMRRSRMPSSA